MAVDSKTLEGVANLLKAANLNFLDADEMIQIFVEDMRKFEPSVIAQGAKNFVRNPGKYPNYAALLSAIKDEAQIRTEYRSQEEWRNGVRCRKCQDRGYIFHYWKKDLGDGQFQYTETMMPCRCQSGRARFPWAFQSQKDRDDWVMEKARKGETPPKKIFDLDETEFRQIVGGEITESQYKKEFSERLRNPKKAADREIQMDEWEEFLKNA